MVLNLKTSIFPNGNTSAGHDFQAMVKLCLALMVVMVPFGFVLKLGVAMPAVMSVGIGAILGGYVVARGKAKGAPMRGLQWTLFGAAFVVAMAFVLR